MGDLRYLADTKLSGVRRRRWRAGRSRRRSRSSAIAGRAQTAFAAAVQRLRDDRDTGSYRADYGSRLRDGAGLLALASEAARAARADQAIGSLIEEESARGRTTSTQENAWMVLAAQALRATRNRSRFRSTAPNAKGAFYRTYQGRGSLAERADTIANSGAEPAHVVRKRHGQPDRARAAHCRRAMRSSAATTSSTGRRVEVARCARTTGS